MVEGWHILRWILAGNLLDFISFSAAENPIFFTDDAGLTGLVLSIFYCFEPF